MKLRRHARRKLKGFGDDDSDPPVSIWGDIPFSDPGASLSPVSIDLPDNTTSIPGLNQPAAGVSTDSSGMSVVTVTGGQTGGLSVWGWLIAALGVAYLLESK